MTAHCSCATGAPTSLLIVGSRIVTADVFAFTTSAEIGRRREHTQPGRAVATPSAAIELI